MLIGSMLSIGLQGCGRKVVEATPPPVVVKVKDTPPADLLQCPQPPAGIPAGVTATIPAPARAALIDLASAYRAAVAQLRRLIDWHDPPAPCRSFSLSPEKP